MIQYRCLVLAVLILTVVVLDSDIYAFTQSNLPDKTGEKPDTTDTPQTGFVTSVVSKTYGPANEPCTTNGMALSPSDNWESRLEAAKPGDTFLLRAGTYRVTGTLALPSGSADKPIVLKAYNCEAATILGESSTPGHGVMMRPGSYNTIAGLHIESATHEGLIAVHGNIRQVEFRHNALYGGRNNAITIRGRVANITFIGNDVNSGPGQLPGITNSSGGHVFVVAPEARGSQQEARKPRNQRKPPSSAAPEAPEIPQEAQKPRNQRKPISPVAPEGAGIPNGVHIVRNKIRGAYFGDLTAGDDTIAVAGGNNVVIEANWFTDNYNIEQVIDIKSRWSRVPVIIRGNVFQNNFLGTHGGQDGGPTVAMNSAEIVVGDHDVPPALLQHVIEYNRFERGISVGASNRPGSAIIRNNIFHAKAISAPRIIFNQTYNTLVINNTFYRGGFKIGRTRGCIPVGGLTFKNNIFYETFVNDQTDNCPNNSYTLAHNVLYKLPSGFKRGVQQANITTDPFFINPAAGDFRLKAESAARKVGEGGMHMGVLLDSRP
jgi:hypothetical protein